MCHTHGNGEGGNIGLTRAWLSPSLRGKAARSQYFGSLIYLLFMELWAATKKCFMLVLRCHQLSRFLANGHLPRVLHQSRLSANDKFDNEVKLGTAHRSGIHFRAEDNPGKPQLGDC
jgi:hypothetical protein